MANPSGAIRAILAITEKRPGKCTMAGWSAVKTGVGRVVGGATTVLDVDSERVLTRVGVKRETVGRDCVNVGPPRRTANG